MIVLEKELSERIDEVFMFPCIRGVYKHDKTLWYMCAFGDDVVALRTGDTIYQQSDGAWGYKKRNGSNAND